MQNFKVNVKLKSSVITPFHSDTFWGHICWGLRYTHGQAELSRFLKSYIEGEPPLIISNGFPKGFIPYPFLPPMEKNEVMSIVQRFWRLEDFVNGIGALKKLSKMRLVSMDILKCLEGREISNQLLVQAILENPQVCPQIAGNLPTSCPDKYDNDNKITCGYISCSGKPCPQQFGEHIDKTGTQQMIVYHSKINRLSGTTHEGSLFTTNENFYGAEDFEIYCKIGENFTEEKLKDCLEFINMNGYGRKKSTGKGKIECTLESDYPDIVKSANAFMSLSNYVPKADEATNGYYSILTKYGKLGGHFASSSLTTGENPIPFKYPLIMFEAGSVFFPKQTETHYGRIVDKVHPVTDPRIVHYGIAYPLFLKVEAKDD